MQYENLSTAFFILLTVYLGFLTGYLIIKAQKKEAERKFYFLSIALFAVFYMLCRILLIVNSIYGTDPYSLIYVIASFFAVLGIGGLMFAVEKYVYPKLKFIPTITVLVFASLILIVPSYNDLNLVTWWVAFGSASALIIPILYLKVGLKSSGQIRINSFDIAFGIIIFLVGNALNTKVLTDLFPLLLVLAPLTMLIGLLLFQMGLK